MIYAISRTYPAVSSFTNSKVKNLINRDCFIIDRNKSVSNFSLHQYNNLDKMSNYHLISFDRYILIELDEDIKNNVFGIINLRIHREIFDAIRMSVIDYQQELISKIFDKFNKNENQLGIFGMNIDNTIL